MTDRKLQFTRIKHDGQVTELDYLTEHGDDTAKTELSSESEPSPEFLATLRGLKRPLLKFLELPVSYGESIEVRTVALKYAKGTFTSFVVTAIKPLKFSNGPLVLNTPNINIPEGDAPSCIDEMIGLIEDLVRHAAAYELGHRAQLDAFAGDDEQKENGNGRREQQSDIEIEISTSTWEIRRALDWIAPVRDEFFGEDAEGPVSDNVIARTLLDTWEEVEYVDEDAEHTREQRWLGIFRHQLLPHDKQDPYEAPRFVWCAVRTDAAVPAFWYDIEPDLFLNDIAARAATLRGRALFDEVRRLRDLSPFAELPADEFEVEDGAREYTDEEKDANALAIGWEACPDCGRPMRPGFPHVHALATEEPSNV